MKRFISSMLVGLCVFSAFSLNAMAEDNIKVYVNGSEVSFDQQPIIENSRTLVPFRAVLDKMGAKVEWNAEDKIITCTNGDVIIKLTVNDDEMKIGDESIKLDVPAKIVNGRTLVPLRAISEGMGADVNWNGENKSVTIDTQIVSKEPYTNETFAREAKNDDGDVVIKASLTYPVFNGYGDAGDKINEYFRQSAKEEIGSFVEMGRDEAIEYYSMTEAKAPWEYIIECEVPYVGEDYISVVGNISLYQGGAHPIKNKTAFLFDAKTGEELYLNDIAGEDTDLVTALAENGFKKMVEKNSDDFLVKPEEININDASFYLSAEGYSFYYDPAVIAPYAKGYVEYTVTKSDVEKAKKENKETDENTNNDSIKVVKKTINNEEKYKEYVSIKDDVEYPVLEGDAKGIDKINKAYYSYIEKLIEDFNGNKKDAEEFLDSVKPDEYSGWSLYVRGDVSYIDEDKVCIATECSEYLGGAHPNGYLDAVIYDLNTGKELSLEDIVEDKEKVIEEAKEGFAEMIKANPDEYFEDALDSLDMENAGYCLTDEGIEFYFEPYALAPYARGRVTFTVEI